MTLTCSAMLGAGVDNPAVIRYSYIWLDTEGTEIVSRNRTIITPAPPSTSSSSTLTLSPLGTTDTNFTCRVTLSDVRNLLLASDPGEQRTNINVLSTYVRTHVVQYSVTNNELYNYCSYTSLFSVPSAPAVMIMSAGESIAGVNHSLTCSVTLEQNLRAPLLIQWTAPNGSIIQDETLVDVTVSSSSNLSLTFNPLHTSHGGQYSCITSVNVSEARVFISGQASINITVHYPHLMIVKFLRSGECMIEELATLVGNVTLTPDTHGSPTFSYTWQVPPGQNITNSTGDYTVSQGFLRVGNIENNTGNYTLHVCVNIPETGVVNFCDSTSFTLSSNGKIYLPSH